MSDYRYIIVGGGMTADAAVRGIREKDKSGKIAVFSSEEDPPYNRPPLSKALWKGDPVDSIWRKTQELMADFFPSQTVVSVDRSAKSVKTRDGNEHRYERLLLATGGKPRQLPFGRDDIIYFRTLEDYRRLRSISEKEDDFAVIGGGFIGSEIAAALTMSGKRVTMIFPETGLCSRVFPGELSKFVTSYYSEKGVRMLGSETVASIEKNGGRLTVRTKSGKGVVAGGVVAGIGILPEDGIARSIDLATDNGIVVDEFLRTTDRDIFAAGDVANFHSVPLEKRIRVEHEDNANTMGAIAGRNMAGGSEPYNYLPFFYSDMFDLGYEAVGELDSRLETFEDWVEKNRKGVIYYLKEGAVRGVLLWNTWGKVDDARALIVSKKIFGPEALKGLIKD